MRYIKDKLKAITMTQWLIYSFQSVLITFGLYTAAIMTIIFLPEIVARIPLLVDDAPMILIYIFATAAILFIYKYTLGGLFDD